MSTHYDVLGVAPEAGAEEIRKAYRKQAMRYHPDKNRDNVEEATSVFKLVAEAYEVLSNPSARQAYDARICPQPARSYRQAMPSGGPSSRHHAHQDPWQWAGTGHSADLFGQEDNDEYSVHRAFDLFEMLFAGLDRDYSDPWGAQYGLRYDNGGSNMSMEAMMAQAMDEDVHNFMMMSALLSMGSGLGSFDSAMHSGLAGNVRVIHISVTGSNGGTMAGQDVHSSSDRHYKEASAPTQRARDTRAVDVGSEHMMTGRSERRQQSNDVTPPSQGIGNQKYKGAAHTNNTGSTMAERINNNYASAEQMQESVVEANKAKVDRSGSSHAKDKASSHVESKAGRLVSKQKVPKSEKAAKQHSRINHESNRDSTSQASNRVNNTTEKKVSAENDSNKLNRNNVSQSTQMGQSHAMVNNKPEIGGGFVSFLAKAFGMQGRGSSKNNSKKVSPI